MYTIEASMFHLGVGDGQGPLSQTHHGQDLAQRLGDGLLGLLLDFGAVRVQRPLHCEGGRDALDECSLVRGIGEREPYNLSLGEVVSSCPANIKGSCSHDSLCD